MSYSAATTELRQMLGDAANSKRTSRKKLVGPIDGSNTKFRTYDKRVVEDSFQVFVNGSSAGFILDDAISGELTLSSAPDVNARVEASYYWQWWLDEELKTFLNKGAEVTSQFTSSVPDQAYLSVIPGLKGAALNVAASYAVRALVIYLMNRKHSQEFNLEEDKNEDENFGAMIDAFGKQADQFYKEGMQLRDDFYKRQGQRNVPAFGLNLGRVTRYGPQR